MAKKGGYVPLNIKIHSNTKTSNKYFNVLILLQQKILSLQM